MRREVTAAERADIKNLVTKMCANYCGTYKVCMPLDCACYMFGRYWTGGYCKYFTSAVLPLNASLTAALTDSVKTRPCVICGADFLISSNYKKIYCSPACTNMAKKQQQRGYMKKRRYRC